MLTRSFKGLPAMSRVALVGILGLAVLTLFYRMARAWSGTDFFADDAYYYAVIARNLAATGRMTFDGTTLTNGFHPLLLWLEALGFKALGTGGSPRAEYLALNFGMAVVFLATCMGTLRIALERRARDRDDSALDVLVLVLGILLVPRLSAIYLNGMEGILELPLLALVGWLTWQRNYRAAGWCGALLMLARLDTLPFVLAPLTLAAMVREQRARRSLRSPALHMLLPAIAASAILMIAYQWIFRHPLPISGSLKSTFPVIHLQPGNFFDNCEERLGLRIGVAGAILGTALLGRAHRVRGELRAAGLTAAGLALVQALVLVLFQKWSKATPAWYLATMLPCGCLALGLGLANVLDPGRLRVVAALGVMASVALNLAWFSGKAGRLGIPVTPSLPFARHDASVHKATLDFIATTPDSAVWASSDCGKVAFWSRRRFVNLDGLVNDFDYQDRLRDQELGPYMREMHVRYLLFGAWATRRPEWGRPEPVYQHRVAPALYDGNYEVADYYLYSYRWHRYSEHLPLPRSAEVWRSGPMADGPVMAKLVVFDLDRLGAASGAGAGGR